MHDELIAYLLGGLDVEELEQLEIHLAARPEMHSYLKILERGLEPLEADEGEVDPPPGLAVRTCQHLWKRMDVCNRVSCPGGNACQP